MNEIEIAEAIKLAHNISGAPGRFVQYCSDNKESTKGSYLAKLQYGEQRYRWTRNGDRLTVRCSWSISGDRQRKQATVTIESLNEETIKEKLSTVRFH